MLIDIMSKP